MLKLIGTDSKLQNRGPELSLACFTGPLELLCHLVEAQKIDIYNIPIAEVTEQYMSFLQQAYELDLDIASEFLLMAAKLLQIKSRLLLPHAKNSDEAEVDPREELVLKILEYRRCRLLASFLLQRSTSVQGCKLHLAETAKRLGIDLDYAKSKQDFDEKKFLLSMQRLAMRNEQRYNRLSEKLSHILKREKVSISAKIRQICSFLKMKGSFLFSDLFTSRTSRMEKLTSFLALLELMRTGSVRVKQEGNFAEISIEEGCKLENQKGEEDAR